ncbi:MAG: hypothetical protein HY035_06750 [Nitrospirae bacterium]|nr:hypothetical protein [Nitrospirota bacterium]
MMRKSYSFRCVFFVLILSAFSLIVFSLKDSVHSTTDTSGIALENNPYGIAINPNTDIAVVANEKSDSVSIVDLNTQTVLSTIPVGKAPRGVAIDRGLNLAVIGNSHDNTVSIIDLSTNKVTSTIPIGKEPQGIAINQSTHRAYVANHKDDTISVIDLFSRQNLGIIPVGKEPKDIAIDQVLNLALVVNEKDYNVSVIDLNTYQITRIVPVGKKPQSIDINPETHLAAVVNEKDNSITVINLQNWQTTTIPVGKHPIDIAINQLDNRALVICDEDRTLLLIDLNTNTILKNYALNKLPKAVAVNNYTNIAGIVDDKTDSLTLIQLPNPVSEITSLTPASAQRGSNGIILTIEGNKFITSSVAYFNSQALTTAFTDNHNIRITIPKEMLANAGLFPVTVVNPSPDGGMSEAINFNVKQETTVQPLPEGSFGKQYEDLIPANATKSYDPKRFSIITGIVKDRAKNPLSEVKVSIHNHSEYGSAQTNTQGRFSIPANGGGTITVVYEKSGFITTHRQVYVPWNDIATTETIAMIPEDTVSTTFAFDGNASTTIIHKSSTITDESGSRSLTMVFSGDNKVYAKNSDGTEVILSSITTRATEFETPESMPAKLPPNSAYTYASKLSVDGAKNVRFEKPVIVYIDNFLGFKVGEKVPVGYYDRDRAVWVPSDNGVVVKLLDTNGDGIVDGLDNVGDGLPHDFNVAGLTDPAKYKPNSTYWRVSINHFTPWDANWPFGPSSDAVSPNAEGNAISDQQMACSDGINSDDSDYISSYCERRSRIFHEDIPIPGTDLTLHYASHRVKGYKSIITIPASGPTVPSSLKSIIVKMDVAGRQFETTLPPQPNQKVEFIWDGLDYLGNQVIGSRTADISIGFVYQAVYYSAGNFAQAFAQAGTDVTGIWGRQEFTSWKRSALAVNREEKIIANGWTLSAHHYLNPLDPSTLYKGNGTTSRNNARIIDTIAGNGQSGFSGDGGPATQAMLSNPYGAVVDSAGNIYIADLSNQRVRKVDAAGIITTAAGNGQGGFSGDGGAATQASFQYPFGIAVDSAGNIYITDTSNHRIRKVDTSGVITTVAGNGQYGFSGDGGSAIQARLYYPFGVTVDTVGNIYIADLGNQRIRKVDTNGVITTAAGDGESGFSGDGGPAISARLNNPYGVTADNAGNIYIADFQNQRIRKVDTSGIITTVAGNGQYGFSGDGGPATQAMLYYPFGVAVDSAGNIYIADHDNHRIRKVDTSGIITTVAGTGQYGFSGDGGAPTQAMLNHLNGVAVDTGWNVYIADTSNNRIRKIFLSSALAGLTLAGDIIFTEENGLGYILDSTGLHKYTIDLATGKTLLTFGYNQDKKLISITDRFGNQTTIQRDGSGIPTSITSPDGIITSLTIDGSNNLTKVTYPDNTSYSFTYTTESLMTDEYDTKNNHFVHQFDANGRITNISDPEGGAWSYSRTVDNAGNISVNVLTGEGNLTTYNDKTDSTGAYTSLKTEPTGAVTTITRSSDGLTGTEQLCGMKQSLKYDLDTEYKFKYIKESTKTSPAGLTQTTAFANTYQDTNADKKPDLITETTTLNSKSWTMSNNVLTGIITNTSPLGRTITTQYDILNLLTKQITVSGLSPANYSYDARGRLTGITTGSRTTAIAYDTNGNIDYVITPDNKTFDYSYDVMGRLRQELRPDGTIVSYDYDNNGNMTVLTNPKSINNTFDFTANDQRKTWATPMSGSYLYSYDKERKLKTIQFPSGKLITNAYTNGLLTSTQTPEGTTNYSYGCSNNLTGATRGSESIAFTYDGSLLKTDTRSGLFNQTISYTYNNDFRLSSIVYAGTAQNFGYDNDGLLTTAGAFTITRNAQNGLPVSVSDGVITNARIFSGYGELDSNAYFIAAVNKYSYTLTRDLAGRITQRVENVSGETITWDYSYDSLGRLTEVKKNNVVSENYSYDANGNRLTGNAVNYSYSNEDHVLTAGADTYQFDVDGFLTSKTTGTGTTTFNYSARGELLSVTKPDGTVVSYDHDPFGRRIAKRVNGTITEKYLWADAITLLAVYDGNNNLMMRFNYADGRLPLSMTFAGATYYLSYDQVGSLRVVTDSTGNIIKQIDYDTFGNVINDTNPSFSVPFGFAGGLYDRDTGLVRFGLRDYDPAIGRWTAKDPIDFRGGDTNLFNYVGNNPVRYTDPTGLAVIVPSGGGDSQDKKKPTKCDDDRCTNEKCKFFYNLDYIDCAFQFPDDLGQRKACEERARQHWKTCCETGEYPYKY